MKLLKNFLILCLCLFQSNYFLFAVCAEKPLLVVISMVKNEQPVMEKTLKPFFDAGLQHYLILDTGSTDGTVQTVCDLFKKYKITHGYIEEKPFVDFATSRNHALDCAEKLFPGAVFFLMIDAEWYVHNVAGLIQFCKQHENDPSAACLVKRIYPDLSATDYTNWLFKAHKGIRYIGAIHEYINYNGNAIKVADDIFIEMHLSGAGNQRTSCRLYRDIDILLQEYKKNPQDLRTISLLGQTYACLGNDKKALYWYGKRCRKNDHSEENHLAHYGLGLIYRKLGNWSKALPFFWKAFALRPQRIEALVNIATYFLQIQDYYSAYVILKHASSVPVPSQELLLIMPEMYHFTRYFLLAQAAEQVGEYEVARNALMKILEHDPSNVALQNKILSYQQIMQHAACCICSREYWCNWCNGDLWLSRPEWFNIACLSFGIHPSNRCNTFYGNSWRCWFGPAFI